MCAEKALEQEAVNETAEQLILDMNLLLYIDYKSVSQVPLFGRFSTNR